MKLIIYNYFASATVKVLVGTGVLLCLATGLPLRINYASTRQNETAKSKATADNNTLAVASFNERVKQYVKLREQLEGKLPKLSDESKPGEIEAHQTAFVELIRGSRVQAKPGDIFAPDIAQHIRHVIREELRDGSLKGMRARVSEVNPKGVPLRVNHLYPETKELLEMPPTLLLKLPELPKQLRYRFIGRHLLLMDRESQLIIDYMLNAL